MEKVLSNEITKFLIILGIGGISLTVILAKLVSKIRGSFKPFQKSTIIYLLVLILFFAVVAAISAVPSFFTRIFSAFVFLQLFFLLLGSLNIYFMHTNLKWSGDDKSFFPEFLFTLAICFFGGLVFLIIFHWLNDRSLEYFMSASILFFIVPFFFYHSFQKAVAIPPKVLKEWFYPIDQEIEEPDDAKMKNMLVISFEFQKQKNDVQVTNFRAKAPKDMDFGELFYYFINDYNDLHNTSKIEFINGSGEPHGWIFYKKPRWNSVVTKYIDAEKTIFNNKIKEDDVIICRRSLS